MKGSLALAIAILLIGWLPGYFQHQRLDRLRVEHSRLVAEAVKSGLSGMDGTESMYAKRMRPEAAMEADAMLNEIVAYYTEMVGLRNSEAGKEREAAMKARISSMDLVTLRQFIAVLEARQDIPDEFKGSMIGMAILNLSDERPEDALVMYKDAYGFLEGSGTGRQVLSHALGKWAEESPQSAVSWIRDHSEKYSDVAGETVKQAVISGSAANDPELAFKLIGELHPEGKLSAVQGIIAHAGQSPEKRDGVLAALRGHLAAITDDGERESLRDESFKSFTRILCDEGFESGSAWMAKAGLSPEELEKFSAGFSYFNTKGDTGRWIEWLSANVPINSASQSVARLVSEWTQKDYQAAGKWLLAAPDGPAKNSAIRAYATVVAGSDPMVAAQWAITLPSGPDRDATLRAIYQNWPASDREGADAFARQHQLK